MPNKVSFDLPASPWDLQRKALEEDRRRIAAERLAELQMPLEGKLISGVYVPPSWSQGLAKAVSGYLGRKDREHIDSKETKLREEEQASLVSDVQKYLDLMAGKPAGPDKVVETEGKMVDPEVYWKPEPAQTFGLEENQAPPIAPDNTALMQEAMTPPGAMPAAPQAAPPQMPPFASGPPITQQIVPGEPAMPGDPRAAMVTALTSRHPMLQRIAMEQILKQAGAGGEGAITPAMLLKAMQYLTPESVAKLIPDDPRFAQLRPRNDLMTVGAGEAVMPKTSPVTGDPQLLPTTQGRHSAPFQRGGDWYQRDEVTGKETKLDNATKVSLGISNFEPAFGRNQADLVTKRVEELGKLADAARKDNRVLDQASVYLAQGIKTGVLVEPRQYLDKLAQLSGFKSDTPGVSNTDLFLRTMQERAAAILASGAYGAGTGISEKDLEEVKKMATGKDMTQASLETLIRVGKHYNSLVLQDYDRKVQSFGQMPGAVPGVADFLRVPTTGQPTAAPVPNAPKGPLSAEERKELEELRKWNGQRGGK